MLGNAKLISFIGTTSPVEALTFYRDKLGLTLVAEEPSALVFDSSGVMLRISIISELNPLPLTVLGWKVADSEDMVDQLTERGIKFEIFPEFQQDSRALATFPDGTRGAWFRDPDGNLLSITEFPS